MKANRKPIFHCLDCGKFLKRVPVVGLQSMGRVCVKHGLMFIDDDVNYEKLKSAFMLLHRENSFLLKKYMGKGKIK